MNTISMRFLLPILLFFSISGFSQSLKKGVVQNGNSVEYCVTHKIMEQILNDSVRLRKHLAYQAEQARLIEKNRLEKSTQKSIIYKIPVVFHVVHNGGVENISKEQILDQLDILNRDFRLKNEDANDVVPEFQGKPVDVGIEFVLATKAPDGTCFDGITRTKSTYTDFDYISNDYGWQIIAIKEGNDVYRGDWDAKNYLNIYIFNSLQYGAAGFTQNPNVNPNDPSGMFAGISMTHNYIGRIGTGQLRNSRALTHEVGHWLNLNHTWGMGEINKICGDDLVEDTPFTKGYGGVCPLDAANNCDPLIVENVENYMEYSYCSKMFTQGQKERMIAALQSSMAGRNNIWTTENLQFTGADESPLTICKVEFNSDRKLICAGESISFSDQTIHQPTGWLWKTPGGTPSESTEENPVIQYNTPGIYSVTLTANLNGTSGSVTKTNVIRVMSNGFTIPYYESFENYSSLPSSNNWTTTDQAGDNEFKIYSSGGYSGQKCVMLANGEEVYAGSTDELISSTIDLSSVQSYEKVTLSFRYSYRKANNSTADELKIVTSNNCGHTWGVKKTMSSSILSSLIEPSVWEPSSKSDWTTVHVTSIASSNFTKNFRFKFLFTGRYGNNIYIDDINLYKGDPSDNIVLGINENPNSVSEVIVFPNPVEEELNVHFSIPLDKEVSLRIHDITGKITQSYSIKANEGSNMVLMNTRDLAPGMYFLNLQIDNSQKTVQFIVK